MRGDMLLPVSNVAMYTSITHSINFHSCSLNGAHKFVSRVSVSVSVCVGLYFVLVCQISQIFAWMLVQCRTDDDMSVSLSLSLPLILSVYLYCVHNVHHFVLRNSLCHMCVCVLVFFFGHSEENHQEHSSVFNVRKEQQQQQQQQQKKYQPSSCSLAWQQPI